MAVLTLPEEEASFLEHWYRRSRVILEYGSGGSTQLAAQLAGKLVFSVESDRDWARKLQAEIDAEGAASSVILYPVSIGETGKWGRPVGSKNWNRFHRYPLAIWDEPFFRHPDLVLIDGRFRPACFAAVCMKITTPVTVLFDDYVERQKYHVVERISEPVEIVGRMARFDLVPGLATAETLGLLVSLFSEATYAGRTPDYEREFDPGKG